MLDEFAHRVSDFCQIFISDNESCNQILKAAIWGELSPELKRKMFDTKWFCKLKHSNIQGLEILPHMPLRLCTVNEEPIFAMTGPAHSEKNAFTQIAVDCRTVHCGRHFVDATGCLEHQLPIPAYVRKDPQSDRLCSLLASPFFMVPSDTWFGPGLASLFSRGARKLFIKCSF